jgi:hypothetical protein
MIYLKNILLNICLIKKVTFINYLFILTYFIDNYIYIYIYISAELLNNNNNVFSYKLNI